MEEEEAKDEADVIKLNKEKIRMESKPIKFKKLKYVKITIQSDIYSPISETPSPALDAVAVAENPAISEKPAISESLVKFKIPKNVTKKNRS